MTEMIKNVSFRLRKPFPADPVYDVYFMTENYEMYIGYMDEDRLIAATGKLTDDYKDMVKRAWIRFKDLRRIFEL